MTRAICSLSDYTHWDTNLDQIDLQAENNDTQIYKIFFKHLYKKNAKI